MLDSVYLGYASGDSDTDSYAIRKFCNEELQLFVCQSYSKNLCLYSERIGALHVVLKSSDYVPTTKECLRSTLRSDDMPSRVRGSLLASLIGRTPQLKSKWRQGLKAMFQDVADRRKSIYDVLVKSGITWGIHTFIVAEWISSVSA